MSYEDPNEYDEEPDISDKEFNEHRERAKQLIENHD